MDRLGLVLRVLGCVLLYLGCACGLKLFWRVWWFHLCVSAIIAAVLVIADRMLRS